MSQIKLLKEYIQTLQLQNEAKNKQRSTLYQKIDELTSENQNMYAQIHRIKNIQINTINPQIIKEKQQYISQLHQNIQYLESQVQNIVKILEQKDNYLKNIVYQQEKDGERIIDLQKIVKQFKNKQCKLKQEIIGLKNQLISIKEQNKNLIQQLQNYQQQQQNKQNGSNQQNSQARINQLIENYEKIQQIAKQKQVQNQYLKQQNQSLIQEVQQLKKIVQVKLNQIKNLKRSRRGNNSLRDDFQYRNSFSGIRQRQRERQFQLLREKSQREQIITNMDLVRQNNKLIQRVTELEKQKNMLYVQALDNNWKGKIKSNNNLDTPSVSPLRVVSARSNTSQHNSASKLRLKIQALKQENQQLLESLRI